MRLFLVLAMGLYGALLGSFANVVIWRFPRGESLVAPGSHCPTCGHAVRWYDNVPIVSWMALRGRCRDCGERISARYPVVEAVSAVLWVLAALRWGWSATTVSAAVMFWLLLVLAFIDIDTMRLPNPLVTILAGWGGAAVVLAQFAGVPSGPIVGVASAGPLAAPVVAALAGVILGGGLTLGFAMLYGSVRGKAGFGMGDVKLLAALGLYLGPYVIFALFAGSVLGAVGGVLQVRRAASDEALVHRRFPFGPYLALGAVLAALFGPQAWSAYAGFVGLS